MKIYTKTGDTGETSLIGGTRVAKSDVRIDSYGNVDELNSYIGLIREVITDEQVKQIVKNIQDKLFIIGSLLACNPHKPAKMLIPDLKETDVVLLEQEIDRMNEAMPALQHFILPGGHTTVSFIHIARCVCRRAERGCVNLLQHEQLVEPLIIKYLNRLSDYLFVLARFAGKQLNVDEVIWDASL